MQVLLIFTMLPEEAKIFRFKNPDAEQLRILTACQGKYVNSDEDESYPQEVSDFLLRVTDGTHDDKLFMTESNEYADIDGLTRIVMAGFYL